MATACTHWARERCPGPGGSDPAVGRVSESQPGPCPSKPPPVCPCRPSPRTAAAGAGGKSSPGPGSALPCPPRRGRVFVLFTRSGGRVSVGKGEAGNGFYLTFFISVRESLGSSNIH